MGDRGVSPAEFRDSARRFPGAVCLAAAAAGEDRHAVTATAFSLCLDPPLVFLALDNAGQLIRLIERAGHVGISVLAGHHQALAEECARRHRPLQLPEGMPLTTAVTGAPLIGDALAWFDARVEQILRFGDHAVVVARAVATWSRPDGEPLLYFDRAYHEIGPSRPFLAPGAPAPPDA